MNQEYINYAEKLSDLGDKILNISQTYFKTKLESCQEYNNTLNSFIKGAEEYAKCFNILTSIIPPVIVKNEHVLLINELGDFVNSSETIWKHFKNGDYKEIKPIVEKYIMLQRSASENIVNISTKIGDILLAN